MCCKCTSVRVKAFTILCMFLRSLFELNNKSWNKCLCDHAYSDLAGGAAGKEIISQSFILYELL